MSEELDRLDRQAHYAKAQAFEFGSLDDLDQRSAIHIMGWEFTNVFFFYKERGGNGFVNKETWMPTRNIAQAWEMLEKFSRDEPVLGFHFTSTKDWCVCFGQNSVRESAPTAPEAIVRACLAAKGVKL